MSTRAALRFIEYATGAVLVVAAVRQAMWGRYDVAALCVLVLVWVVTAGVHRRFAERWERQAETWQRLCEDYATNARARLVSDEELLGRVEDVLAWAEKTPAERAAGDA